MLSKTFFRKLFRTDPRLRNESERFEIETLETRVLLDAGAIDLGSDGVFENAAPSSASVSGEGTSRIVFGEIFGASFRSVINFQGAQGLISNDTPMAAGKFTFSNGENVIGTTISSVDLNFRTGISTGKVTIPLEIKVSDNTGDSNRDADTLGMTVLNREFPINTDFGKASLIVNGLSPVGKTTPVKSFQVFENSRGSANLWITFQGLDKNDQITEAKPLGKVNNEVTTTDKISHVSDVDIFRINVEKDQKLAFDIDTPKSGNLDTYLKILDRTGKVLKFNNNAKSPDEATMRKDSFLKYKFEKGGAYYVAVSNFRNTFSNVKNGGNDFTTNRPTSNLTGNYKLTVSDADDQLVEAVDLGMLDAEKKRNETIAVSKDVDVYSFEVKALQRIAFDIDFIDDNFRSYLRVFDASGKELAKNASAKTVRETNDAESFLEHQFTRKGTFFIAVSGLGNSAYNSQTGQGDRHGRTGRYRLTVTPITLNTTGIQSRSRIEGEVRMPNRENHRESIDVFMQRVNSTGGNGINIQPRARTWLVIHGRIDNSNSFRRLAGAIVRQRPGDQVLIVDWRQGANEQSLTNIKQAEWTPYVADWVSDNLNALSVPSGRLFVVGHSFGSYMAYEIGRQHGGVRGLVALDLAIGAQGYNFRRVDFTSVSAISWAFYGAGSLGSAALSGTAHEAFTTKYAGTSTTREAHSAPIYVFESLVRGRPNGSSLFSLNRLLNVQIRPDFKANVYADSSIAERDRKVFEGIFTVRDDDDNGRWEHVSNFRYTDKSGIQRDV